MKPGNQIRGAMLLALLTLFSPPALAAEEIHPPCARADVRLTRTSFQHKGAWRWEDPSFGVDLLLVESGKPNLDIPFRTHLLPALCLLRSVPDTYQRLLARREAQTAPPFKIHQARVIRMLALDKGVQAPTTGKRGPSPAKLRQGAVLADYAQGVLTFFPTLLQRPFFTSPLFWAGNLVHEWTHKEQGRQGLLQPEAVSFLELHADLHQQWFLESLPGEIIQQQAPEHARQLDNARQRNADTLRMMGTHWFPADLSTLERICRLEIHWLAPRFGSRGFNHGSYCNALDPKRLTPPPEPIIPVPEIGVHPEDLASEATLPEILPYLDDLEIHPAHVSDPTMPPMNGTPAFSHTP